MTSGHGAQEWDSRYAGSDRVWSASPNAWVSDTIGAWTPGRALDLGAGEGRHAVWLASLGWQVTAVDFSAVGIERGRAGAREAGVDVDWVVADVGTWEPPDGATFVLVFAGLPAHRGRRPLESTRMAGPGWGAGRHRSRPTQPHRGGWRPLRCPAAPHRGRVPRGERGAAGRTSRRGGPPSARGRCH